MTTLTITARTNSSVKLKTHKDMDFKVTIGIWGAKSYEEAEQKVNEMLDAYDLNNFADEDGNKTEINWYDDDLRPM